MTQATLLPSSASPSIILHNGKAATTSLELAKFFGKRHAHILRDIENIRVQCPENFTQPNFGMSEYMDETGHKLPMCIICRDGFALLAMGYTGKKTISIKLSLHCRLQCNGGTHQWQASPAFTYEHYRRLSLCQQIYSMIISICCRVIKKPKLLRTKAIKRNTK